MEGLMGLILPILLFTMNNVIHANKNAVGCDALNCGENTICRIVGENSSCVCKDHYVGDPYIGCLRADYPTSNYCGLNAERTILNETTVCHCPANYTGDPYTYCQPITEENKRPVSCNDNIECKENEICYGTACKDPCSFCGKNAECLRFSFGTKCTCPFEYVGDPYKECFYFYQLPPEEQSKY